MRILVWHVHGGWMDAFVRGGHEYLIPTTPGRDAWGLGRGGRDWPASAVEVPPASIADLDPDVVVLQRPQELDLVRAVTGREPGRDLPAVYVEHNLPRGDVPSTVHPLADRPELTIVHVTPTNALLWDTGSTPTRVVEHGVPDPGLRWAGELEAAAVVINEPVRRGRVAGTDLLPRLARALPLTVYGIATEQLASAFPRSAGRITPAGDVPTATLHAELARHRAYAHPYRWTSLGLSLIEAMLLGMPVAVIASVETLRAVPPEAGVVSPDPADLVAELSRLAADPDRAASRGRVAREAALSRFGLPRFHADWDAVLADRVATRRRPAAPVPALRRIVLEGSTP